MTMDPCFTPEELKNLGIVVGKSPRIHRTVQFFNPTFIEIGDHVRIDCFSVISAGPNKVVLGSFIHFGASVHLFGGFGVQVGDYCGLSSRVSIFTSTDDYSEGFLTNPTVPNEFRKVKSAPVTLGSHSIVGCGSVIMPGVTLGFGCSIGALSYVNKSVPEGLIAHGNPLVGLGQRNLTRITALEESHRARL